MTSFTSQSSFQDFLKRQDRSELRTQSYYKGGGADDGIKVSWLTQFLGSTYADILLQKWVKVTVIVTYLAGLGVAIWGVLNLQQGLDPINLTADDSYFHDFFDRFRDEYPVINSPTVMIGIREPLDYTDENVRNLIDGLLSDFQKGKYFVEDDIFVSSWLRGVERYLKATERDITQLTLPQLIHILRNEFLQIPDFERFIVDIDFSPDNQSIENSRFAIQSHGAIGVSKMVELMEFCRNLAVESPYKTVVYAQQFIFGDQYNSVLSTTLINLGIAVVSILGVSLFFIPSITTSIWITLATLSICVYTFGFMVHWGVSLDSVSMINLIQSIGFSVDFTAHISYHFVMDQSGSPKQAARMALGQLGTPIIQGALSTLLAVSVLAFSVSYIFRTFCKIVSLVMIFGFFHAMVLLPVLLSMIRIGECLKKPDRKVGKSTDAKKMHVSAIPVRFNGGGHKFGLSLRNKLILNGYKSIDVHSPTKDENLTKYSGADSFGLNLRNTRVVNDYAPIETVTFHNDDSFLFWN